MAPLFVWLEILFEFGYKPKLAMEIKQTAGKRRAEALKAKK